MDFFLEWRDIFVSSQNATEIQKEVRACSGLYRQVSGLTKPFTPIVISPLLLGVLR